MDISLKFGTFKSGRYTGYNFQKKYCISFSDLFCLSKPGSDAFHLGLLCLQNYKKGEVIQNS